MTSKRKNIEHDIQVECIEWYRETFPTGFIFAVPNCGMRNIQTYYFMVNEGLTKGAPELVATRPDGTVVFIEMKSPVGYLSPAQKDVQSLCSGISEDLYHVCKSVEEFKQLFV